MAKADNRKGFESGVSFEETTFQWKISNFSIIAKSEDLLSEQTAEFQFTNSNGIKSNWQASLSSTEEGTTAAPKTRFWLHFGLIEGTDCCSEIFALASPKLVDGAGAVVFSGSPGDDPKKYTQDEDDFKYWRVFELTPERKLPTLAEDMLIIHISVNFLTMISQSQPTLAVEAEEMRVKRKRKLSDSIEMLFNDQTQSDVKIISKEGQEFFAYRWVLSAGSEVFEAMFRTEMKENKTGILEIKDLSGTTLKLLLRFIYTGKVDDEWTLPGIVEELLYAADKYLLTDLKDFLDHSLEKLCTVESAGNLLALAKATSLEKAEADILAFIKGNNMDADALLEIIKNSNIN